MQWSQLAGGQWEYQKKQKSQASLIWLGQEWTPQTE